MTLSRDFDIRAGVVTKLLAEDVLRRDIRHEIPLGSFSEKGRADVVVLTDRILGFEIKSGRDKLDRLAAQREAYGRHFDLAAAILDRRHYDKAPYHRGLTLCWEQDSASLINLAGVPLRTPRRYHFSDRTAVGDMASLLWRDEMISVARTFAGFRFKTRTAALDWARENMSLAKLRPCVIEMLRRRPLNGHETTFWADFDAMDVAA